ncbi:MAG: hypothetical protein ACREDR_07220, partial [Blastocatellia bacterium]
MTRSVTSTLLYFVMVMAWTSPCQATIIPVLDLHRLTDSADIVAVGEVVRVTDRGFDSIKIGNQQETVRRQVYRLRIERSLKGLPRSTHVDIHWFVGPYFPYGGLRAGEFGVFFLRREGDGLAVADPFYPFLVAVRDAPSATGGTYHRIVHEVAYALHSARSLPAERENAVAALSTVRDDRAATSALRVAGSTDRESAVRLL